jgi:hypothetical protein
MHLCVKLWLYCLESPGSKRKLGLLVFDRPVVMNGISCGIAFLGKGFPIRKDFSLAWGQGVGIPYMAGGGISWGGKARGQISISIGWRVGISLFGRWRDQLRGCKRPNQYQHRLKGGNFLIWQEGKSARGSKMLNHRLKGQMCQCQHDLPWLARLPHSVSVW